MKWVWVAAALLAMLPAGVAAAECSIDHREALTASIENESPVYAARGATRPIYDVEEDEIDERLSEYLSFPSLPVDNAAQGLLFYVSWEQQVCLFFLERGADAASQMTISGFLISDDAVRFSKDVQDAISGFLSGRAPLERSPYRRNAAGERGAASLVIQEPADAQRQIDVLTELLVPSALRLRLEDFDSLAVLPALNIGMVPFGALDPNGDGVPLIARTAVNIEASMWNVYEMKGFVWEPGIDRIEIFGDPDASNDPEWVFPRLPGASREAGRVGEILGGNVTLGPDVTVESVLTAIKSSSYVHIAAHGISDPVDPMEKSFLALTDGRLIGIDIENLDLPEDQIVVLSACQSALGLALDGGVAGLSRAFIFGGSMMVVSSLWNVDDQATSWIMTRFAELIGETNPIEALRRAQDEARSKWPDPRIWAAFIAFGGRVVSL